MYDRKSWGQLVEALRYKSEGRGFDSRMVSLDYAMTLGPVRRAYLTALICRLFWNLGAWTSWNTQGLSRAVLGWLYLYLYPYRKKLWSGAFEGEHLYVAQQNVEQNNFKKTVIFSKCNNAEIVAV